MQKHVIRTSDRIAFKACRREWDWSSILRTNLVPIRGSKPLEFGTDWHLAMASYYDPDTWHLLKNAKTRDVVHHHVRETFVRANNANRDKYRDADGFLWSEIEDDFKERENLGLQMLNHYFQWAPGEDKFTPRYVEVDFEVPVLDPDGKQLYMPAPTQTFEGGFEQWWPVFYQGKLDGIVEDQFGWYWILEHKTTGQMGATEHLILDEQTGSYAWAVKHILGIRVQGVIYSEALKDFPEPPKELKKPQEGRNYSVNKNQRTTYDIVLETLIQSGENLEPYHDYLSYLKQEDNKFFRRMQVHRNVHEMDDIGHRIYIEAQEMLNPHLPIYPSPSRFTCTRCAFKAPCVAKNDGSDFQFLLDTDYRNRTELEIAVRRARA